MSIGLSRHCIPSIAYDLSSYALRIDEYSPINGESPLAFLPDYRTISANSCFCAGCSAQEGGFDRCRQMRIRLTAGADLLQVATEVEHAYVITTGGNQFRP